MQKYAVLGNPIGHSQSPMIHQQFAQQCGIALQYQALLVPLTAFVSFIENLPSHGFNGVNVTVPFKEQAFNYCQQLTERAQLAGAVNTIKWQPNGEVLGDNTDGIGLLTDLERLQFLS